MTKAERVEKLWSTFISEKMTTPNLKHLVVLGEVAADFLHNLSLELYYYSFSSSHNFHTLYTYNGKKIMIVIRINEVDERYTGVFGKDEDEMGYSNDEEGLGFSYEEKELICDIFREFSNILKQYSITNT